MKTIKFAQLTATSVLRREEGYFFIEGGWFSRFLWRLLHRMGRLKPYFAEHFVYEYTNYESAVVSSLFSEAIHNIAMSGKDPNDYAFLLGGKQFAEIMKGFHADGVFRLPMHDYNFVMNGYRGSFRGLSCHVIPELDGCCVVPKVIIESQEGADRDVHVVQSPAPVGSPSR